MGNRKGLCVRCMGFKWIKGRRLCESCYMQVKRAGNIEGYPTLNDRKSTTICHCYSPVIERLPMWDAEQCRKCGKKVVRS